MNNSHIIIEAVNCMCDAGIIAFFLYKIMKNECRYPAVFILLPMLGGFLISFLFGSLKLYPQWVKLPVIFTTMLVTSVVMFRSKLRSIVFYCLVFIVIKVTSELLPTGALNLLNIGTPEAALCTGVGRYITMACSKIFCFWFAIYIAEYLKPKQRDIPFKNWLLIIFVPLVSLVFLDGIFISYDLAPQRTIVYIVSVLGILLLNIFVFDFFDTYSNTIKLQLMEQRLQSEEENYRLIEEKYTEIRRLRHDIGNQLSATKIMFTQGEDSQAVEHLDKLYSSLNSAGGVCYTGISSIDAIVNMKWDHAVLLGLTFSCKVVFPDEINIDELLLCRIIANLLDNAIEGAESCSSSDKFVYISLIQNNKKLRICVMNSSDEVDTENLTTKKKGFGHGIGVSSVTAAVSQLDGILSFKWEKGIFTADIMIEY